MPSWSGPGLTQVEIARTAISLERIYAPGCEACNFFFSVHRNTLQKKKKKEKMSIYAL